MNDNLHDKISFLSLTKYSDLNQIKRFKQTALSYYNTISKPYPAHFIKDDSSFNVKKMIHKEMLSINPNTVILESKKMNMIEAFIYLTEMADKEYVFYMFGDVVPASSKDIFTPCIEAMDINKNLVQICVGGSFLSTGNSNERYLIKNETNQLCINRQAIVGQSNINPNSKDRVVLNKNKIKEDVVWTLPLDKKDLISDFMYIFGFWNQIMRTSDAKHFIESCIGKCELRSDKNIDFFTKRAHVNDDNFCADHPVGFPQEFCPDFEWLYDREIGFLNMTPYLYALGRSHVSLEAYRLSHMIEIKS
jgi:hypothetical protein